MRALTISLVLLGAGIACGCGALLGIEDAYVVPKSDAGEAPLPESGGTCDDTRSDPHNCGRCGHDCLGGTCSQGRCRPVVVASGQVAPHAIATDGTSAFWISESRVMTVALDGGAAPSLVASAPFPVAKILPTATQGLFVSGAGTVAHAGDAGLEAITTADAGVPAFVPMAADDAQLFFWEPPGIHRRAATGATDLVASAADCRDLALDRTRVLWSSASAIAQVEKSAVDGGAGVLVPAANPTRIAVGGGYVFFLEGTTLRRAPLDGGAATTLTSCLPGADVVADAEWVYCALTAGIVRVNGAGTVDVVLTTTETPVSLAVDAVSVLFALRGGTDVLRVAK
jgi:hypothetical protein